MNKYMNDREIRIFGVGYSLVIKIFYGFIRNRLFFLRFSIIIYRVFF